MKMRLLSLGVVLIVAALTIVGCCHCPPSGSPTGVADLTVPSVTGPSTARTNTNITVHDITLNIGATAAPTHSLFWLSPNANSTNNAILLKDRAVGALATGGAYTNAPIMKIPVNAPLGPQFIVDFANGTNLSGETNWSNNIGSYPITIQ